MAAPWIQVYSNLIDHPKTDKLAELLKLSSSSVDVNVIAAGMMVGIWSWAAQSATDGDLTGVSSRNIAKAAGWKKNPDRLVEAVIEAGFVDKRDDDTMYLHDWLEYAWLLHEQAENKKANDRKRQQSYRERKKQAASLRDGNMDVTAAEHNASRLCHSDNDVTVTVMSHQNHAPTIPNHTIPNLYTSKEDRKEYIDTASIRGCHRDDETPSCLPTEESWEEKKRKAEAIMARYRGER